MSKIKYNKEKLIHLATVDKKTREELSDIFEVSISTIDRWRKENNLIKNINIEDKKKDMLDKLNKAVTKKGSMLYGNEFGKYGLYTVKYYRDIFNCGINELADMLKIENNNYTTKQMYTNEELIKLLSEYDFKDKKITKELINSIDSLPDGSTYIKRFGTLGSACNLAGIYYNKLERDKIYSDEDLLYALNKENFNIITVDNINNCKNLPNYETYSKRFSGIFGIYEKLGIPYNEKEHLGQYYTDEQLIDNLKLFTHKELNWDNLEKDKNFPSPQTYKERFGSLEEAAIKANIPYIFNNRSNVYTDKELIHELRIFEESISYNLIDSNKNIPSSETYRLRFGSLENICKLADIPYNPNNGTSIWEKEVVSFIKSTANETIEENDRTALENGKEIDIYIPDLDIGIECNGDYWHSKKHKNKNYHINKTNRAKEFDITLIHIFESEWENDKESTKQYLRSIINKTTVQIYRGKDNLEIDNMKPMKYINIQEISSTIPKLMNIGKHEIWDCGTTIYEVIE